MDSSRWKQDERDPTLNRCRDCNGVERVYLGGTFPQKMSEIQRPPGEHRCQCYERQKVKPKMSEPVKRGLFFGAGLVVGSVVWLAILRPILP